jgi:hypothetical protein
MLPCEVGGTILVELVKSWLAPIALKMQKHGARKWRELLIRVRKSGANVRFSTARRLGHERV